MAKLNKDDVMKLAKLARLHLTDDEVEEYASELSNILAYVEQLQEAEVGDLAPTNQVTGLINVYREDELIDYGYEPHELLNNVPEVENGQIKVRRMIG